MGLFMDWKLHIVFGWAFFDFILSVLYGYFFLHLVQASKLLLLNKWEVIKVTDVLNSVGVKNRSIKRKNVFGTIYGTLKFIKKYLV